jgi:magnesium-transporting ATPase (P-type)
MLFWALLLLDRQCLHASYRHSQGYSAVIHHASGNADPSGCSSHFHPRQGQQDSFDHPHVRNSRLSSIVLRMSAALFVFFFIILLVMLCRSRLSQVINEGLFCVKYLFLVALFVGALFLPSSILDIYASVSKITSIVYLAIQTIIIIDIFYLVAIKLVERYD